MIDLFFEIINSNKKTKKKMAFIKAAIDTNKKTKKIRLYIRGETFRSRPCIYDMLSTIYIRRILILQIS